MTLARDCSIVLIAALAGCGNKSESSGRPPHDAARAIDATLRHDANIPRGNLASLTVDMIRIPEGAWYTGCDPASGQCTDSDSDLMRHGKHEFYIDRTEVTVAAYAECVRAGRCPVPRPGGRCDEKFFNWGVPGRDDHPVNCITPLMAIRYCEFRNRRLPSEQEWERAARGDTPRGYPWGDEPPTCERAVIRDPEHGCHATSTEPVGSKLAGASQFGVLDMVGNVEEIVSVSARDVELAKFGDPYDAIGMSARGGGFDQGPSDHLFALWAGLGSLTGKATTGFRCALDQDGDAYWLRNLEDTVAPPDAAR